MNPVNLGNATILGQAKTFDKIPLLSKQELENLFQGASGLIESGQPHSIPMALPIGDFLRMATTMKKYQYLLKQLLEVVTLHEKVEGVIPADVTKLAEEARKALSTIPPVVGPPPTKSKLII